MKNSSCPKAADQNAAHEKLHPTGGQAQRSLRIGKLAYPSKAQIERIIAAARASGIDVGGVEVTGDGAIRVMEPRAATSTSTNEFERLVDRL